jgi:hypothetical protein
MKSCIRCNEEKDISEFYKHPQMADGLNGKCKDCCKLQSKLRDREKRKDAEWLKRERERCRLKQERARKNGTAKQTSSAVKQAWRKRNPVKARAHGQAIKAHPVKPEYCEQCKKPSKMLHRHHPDYNKPKEIIWLCPPCHGAKHRKH